MRSYSKGSDEQISQHFRAYEFDCKCLICTKTIIDDDLLDLLDVLRDELGFPIIVTSGYRCDAYQRQLTDVGYETSSGRSEHQEGRAADIKTGHHSGEELEKAARKVGFKTVGRGSVFIHVDLRADKVRAWKYSY